MVDLISSIDFPGRQQNCVRINIVTFANGLQIFDNAAVCCLSPI